MIRLHHKLEADLSESRYLKTESGTGSLLMEDWLLG